MLKIPNCKNRILEIVRKIPCGKTLTYAQVARLAGRPAAYRAVGNILSKNYDPQIPCHRVIRSDGKPGGYNRGAKKKIEKLRSEDIVSLRAQRSNLALRRHPEQ